MEYERYSKENYNKQAESLKQYENLLKSFNMNARNCSDEQVYDENFAGLI